MQFDFERPKSLHNFPHANLKSAITDMFSSENFNMILKLTFSVQYIKLNIGAHE